MFDDDVGKSFLIMWVLLTKGILLINIYKKIALAEFTEFFDTSTSS